jgi:hypothetical protein
LFVKRADWVRFARSVDAAKTSDSEANRWGAARVFTRDDPANVPPWWSVNQVLAWIVTRTKSFVQFVGEREADQRYRPAWVFVHPVVEQLAAESDEGRALLKSAAHVRPNASVFSLAGRALLDAIRAGHISPAVRQNGRSRIMAAHEFAGIGCADVGSDWLDLDPQPLFSSDEVIVAFPMKDAVFAGTPSDDGILQIASETRAPAVKAGRAPDPDSILAKADEMKARGLTGYVIASTMRHEPGFGNVATTSVRELIKGRWTSSGRPKRKDA